MAKSSPDMPNHLIWAIEHHQQLLEEAQRHRDALLVGKSKLERPLRWRRLRAVVGELLIHTGQRLKGDATNTVWG